MKCLGISLIKYLQNLHTENHTILTKEIKVNKWYNIQCLRIEKLCTGKKSVLSNVTSRFKIIPTPASYLEDIYKQILKSYKEAKTHNSQHNIEGKKQSQKIDTTQL